MASPFKGWNQSYWLLSSPRSNVEFREKFFSTLSMGIALPWDKHKTFGSKLEFADDAEAAYISAVGSCPLVTAAILVIAGIFPLATPVTFSPTRHEH
jgi:hypothetical protein